MLKDKELLEFIRKKLQELKEIHNIYRKNSNRPANGKEFDAYHDKKKR